MTPYHTAGEFNDAAFDAAGEDVNLNADSDDVVDAADADDDTPNDDDGEQGDDADEPSLLQRAVKRAESLLQWGHGQPAPIAKPTGQAATEKKFPIKKAEVPKTKAPMLKKTIAPHCIFGIPFAGMPQI